MNFQNLSKRYLKQLLLVIILTPFLIISCNKENLKVSSPSVPGYLSEYIESLPCFQKSVNGSLIIQSYQTIHTQTIERADVSGLFYGTDGAEDKGTLKVGNLEIEADNNNRYASSENLSYLYGTSSTVRLKDGATTYFSKELTLPKMVKITYPDVTDNFIISNQSRTITWEEDLSNNGGVAIIVEYEHDFPENESFISQGYDKTIYNTILSEDNGSYTFNSEDFDGIPDDAFIVVSVIRVGCGIAEDTETGGEYFIYGYSHVDAAGKYMGGLQ